MQATSRKVMVYPLSAFQTDFLKSIFFNNFGPIGMSVQIIQISFTDNMDLIFDFLQYDERQTVVIQYRDTAETYNPGKLHLVF